MPSMGAPKKDFNIFASSNRSYLNYRFPMTVLASFRLGLCTKWRALVASCGKARVLNNGRFCVCMGWEFSIGILRLGSAASSMRPILESVFVFRSMNMRVRRRAE